MNPQAKQHEAMRRAMMCGMDEVEVVVAHRERATLRVGQVFLKIDPDHERSTREIDAMRLAPVPTAPVLWREPPVLALAAVPGTPLERLGAASRASTAAWVAAGVALRALHTSVPPPWPSSRCAESAARLDAECARLVADGLLPETLVAANRRRADAVFRHWAPSFIHGDLHVAHVLVEDDAVSGVLDWSEAGQGDALYDVAILTMGHPDRLDDLLAGYGADVDLDVVRGWWSLRCLLSVRWLVEHGFDAFAPGCEVDVLRRAC